jgi:NitT/TauT family transport system permease protein
MRGLTRIAIAAALRRAASAPASQGLRRVVPRGVPWRSLILPCALLLVWEIASRARWLPPALVPPPSLIVKSWYVWIFGKSEHLLSLYTGTWLSSVLFSTRRVTEGFLIAASAGISLGILVGWYRPIAELIDPSIQMIRPIPITAWVPFAIALFGIRDWSSISLISLGAFFPIVVNTTHGVRDTSKTLIRAAQMLGFTPRQLIYKVVLPSALPSIFTGLRLGVGMAWVCVIVSEMVAVKSGLGYVLWDGYYLGRMDIIVAAMVSVGLLGFLSDRLVILLGSRVLRWKALEFHR